MSVADVRLAKDEALHLRYIDSPFAQCVGEASGLLGHSEGDEARVDRLSRLAPGAADPLHAPADFAALFGVGAAVRKVLEDEDEGPVLVKSTSVAWLWRRWKSRRWRAAVSERDDDDVAEGSPLSGPRSRWV